MSRKHYLIILAFAVTGGILLAQSSTRTRSDGLIEVTDCWAKDTGGDTECHKWIGTREFVSEWANNADDDGHHVRQS